MRTILLLALAPSCLSSSRLCAFAVSDLRAFGVQDTDSTRYSLHAEGVDAKDFAALLDAHYANLEKFFGRAPAEKTLRLELYATQEKWAAAMKADKESAPGAGGYYSPSTKKAYLYVQPSEYYTRQLVLHEATHQFHYLAMTGNKNLHPDAFWYTEGLAEYGGLHNWDGKALRLGVIPAITLENYPAQALKQFDALKQDLAGIVAGTTKVDRPVGWAIIHFLVHNHEKRWKALAALLDAGTAPADAWKNSMGPVTPALVKQFREWLAAHQQPWSIVWTAWQERGDVLEGRSDVNALAVRAAELKTMSAEISPGAKLAGVAFGHASADDFWLAQLDGDGWRVVRRARKKWTTIASGKRAKAERDVIELARDGKSVVVKVNGAEAGRWEAPGAWGLNVDSGRATFRVKETR